MNKQFAAAAILAGSMMSTAVLAETNGALGSASNGSVDVSLSVPELVQLTFPGGDIGLTYSDGSNSVVTEEFCVYSNQASVDFDILVDPANVPGSGTDPVMKSGANEMAYQIDLKTAGGGSTLSSDIPAAGATVSSDSNANQSSKTCASGGNSHEFMVTVLEADIESAIDGSYSDTVNVTITAN